MAEPPACRFFPDCSAYALGILEAAERARFDEHLTRCDRCRDACRELGEALGNFAEPQSLPAGSLASFEARMARRKRNRGQDSVILFAECLQNDFMALEIEAPSAYYVGAEASLKLLGADPEKGPLARMLTAYAAALKPSGRHSLVHVIDIHYETESAYVREHFSEFHPHCVAGTPGARVLPAARKTWHLPNTFHAELESLVGEQIGQTVQQALCGSDDPARAKLGFIGAANDFNIGYHIGVAAQLGARIAVCEELSTNSLQAQGQPALQQLQSRFGIELIPDAAAFMEWLELA